MCKNDKCPEYESSRVEVVFVISAQVIILLRNTFRGTVLYFNAQEKSGSLSSRFCHAEKYENA